MQASFDCDRTHRLGQIRLEHFKCCTDFSTLARDRPEVVAGEALGVDSVERQSRRR
ncbi:hypothetical protein G3O06_17920 [Burkholderia sp. Ac-20345]|uniref:hypothetical protein n=1 Tax=Burkholderia sp. Ac-20345 TaxID=2703891 RepID=UPI00197BAEF4|nr:hypothetical protein [Burkholderia sp. Ac-20345]MBN3779414.1 hypothetical protein [Burkholderia sp. Ac-20345]